MNCEVNSGILYTEVAAKREGFGGTRWITQLGHFR